MDEKEKLLYAENLKRFVFFGIAVSTVATFTAIVAVPLLCLYLQNVHSGVQEEILYCRTKSSGLRGEYVRVRSLQNEFLILYIYFAKLSIHLMLNFI
ncbi:unnamed protein product [Strongylus vulgaris]|uniref:Nematode cuticle collagen N-terminal domain-containing protein n=1 Tax=Strongylus vulgaris TaxID=40348 RepID=A0A3P7IUM0_STRVU|nr:unnamed protein product [Strongylus vulgaris]